MKKNFTHLLILIFVVAISSCGGKKEEGSEGEAFDDAQEESGTVSESLEGVIYNIPSPTEIPYLLLTTGADFNGELPNPHTRADEYQTTFDVAALNLGIYAADVGYLSSYDKTQDALNYITSMKSLADHLGVSTAYDAEMLTRFESNLGTRDSLYRIIDEGVEEADVLLKDENRSHVAALVTTGSFIEGLYIATQLVVNYPNDLLSEQERMLILTPLVRVVLEQEKSLDDLISLATSVPQEGTITEVVADLNALKAKYAELDIEEKISQNQGQEIMNDETLNSLAELIAEMRAGIVG